MSSVNLKGVIRHWSCSDNTPLAIHVYWYGDNWKSEIDKNRLKLKIMVLESGVWLNKLEVSEIPDVHKKIPNPGGFKFWHFKEKDGDFLIYEINFRTQ